MSTERTRSRGSHGWWRAALAALVLLAVPAPTRVAAAEEAPPLDARALGDAQLAAITRPDPDRPLPFRDGERLVYTLGWGMFSVASAELTTRRDTFDGQPAWRIDLEVRTNRFADTFYRVRNHTTAWLDAHALRTLHLTNFQNEGDRHREVTVTFDYAAGTASYFNARNGERRDPVAILPATLDPMGITFHVRSLRFAEGDRLVIPTTNGKEFFLTFVAVAGREVRKFRYGRKQAWLLEPDVKDVGGVFERSKDARIRFWFSADEFRYPLRMESQVAVGSFWAELVRVEQLEGDK